MDFDLPWGTILNSDPQNKIFQTINEYVFRQQSALMPNLCFYHFYLQYVLVWNHVLKSIHNSPEDTILFISLENSNNQ